MPARVGLLLGIDPGLARTGWALLDNQDQVLDCGTVATAPGPSGPRLLRIAGHVRDLVGRHPVAEAALEELFLGRNATSAIGVAEARGAVLLVLAESGVPVFHYKPAQVKSALTGYGVAGKAQMERMLGQQVRLPGPVDDHAADAIAIALCHRRSRRLLRLVGPA
ncbi:MAG: crossover junction endodeoxyribonuclease RuvC [Candidatus Dormibacteraeota bacterium]|nr:crossover junction endodeoxyribonuclease RuvC [Candidatus Dormibacteraeota bacterium]